MKKTKMIICLILSISIGIIVTAPLLNAELFIRPWITRVQGPTAPFTFEVVYADFTITDPDAPTNQISPSQPDYRNVKTITGEGFNMPATTARIDYNIVYKVTNPSEYRTILSSISFFAAQKVQETTRQALIESINVVGTMGGGIEAKGAWVDGVYYNVTCTIPWPSIDDNGVVVGNMDDKWDNWEFRDDAGDTRTSENSTKQDMYNTVYYKWIEGIQGYEFTINDGVSRITYIYLNIDGTWVDVTGRVIFDEKRELDETAYSSSGGFASQMVHHLGSGSKASKENEYNCFFESGESRLMIVSGSVEVKPAYAEISEAYINPIDIIQSGTVQTLTRLFSNIDMEVDLEDFLENHTYIDTHSDTAKIQELTLTQVGNRYIYNTVLSDNQTFQLDKYGLEVFIVPVR